MRSVKGTFHDGKVELSEPVPASAEGPVVVTFLSPQAVDLKDRGIGPAQAADLRSRLAATAEDWDRPEMDVYDEP